MAIQNSLAKQLLNDQLRSSTNNSKDAISSARKKNFYGQLNTTSYPVQVKDG